MSKELFKRIKQLMEAEKLTELEQLLNALTDEKAFDLMFYIDEELDTFLLFLSKKLAKVALFQECIMAFYQKWFQHFQSTNAERLLSALNKESRISGKTFLWWLAATREGQTFLQTHSELLTKGDLNAAPTQGLHAGITVLWWLAIYSEGRAILQAHPELLIKGNLNAIPTEGANIGITVLWWLAYTSEGRAILQAHPELLTKGDLNAAPTEGVDAGITVLWRLANTSEGRAILQAHPELLTKGDLNAAPTEGIDAGTTVLWWLANVSEGRAILQAHPELLAKGNLNAAPTQGTNAGTTILELLIRSNLDLLIKIHPYLTFEHLNYCNTATETSIPRALMESGHTGLIKLAILSGVDFENALLTTEQLITVTVFKSVLDASKAALLTNAISFLQSVLPLEMVINIIYQGYLAEHPDLHFLSLNRFIDLVIAPYLQRYNFKSPNQRFTSIIVYSFVQEKIPLADFSKDKVRYIHHSIIYPALERIIAENTLTFPSEPPLELRKSIIDQILKVEATNLTLITAKAAIETGFREWQAARLAVAPAKAEAANSQSLTTTTTTTGSFRHEYLSFSSGRFFTPIESAATTTSSQQSTSADSFAAESVTATTASVPASSTTGSSRSSATTSGGFFTAVVAAVTIAKNYMGMGAPKRK